MQNWRRNKNPDWKIRERDKFSIIKFAKKYDYNVSYLTRGYKLKRHIDLKKDFFSDLILSSKKL